MRQVAIPPMDEVDASLSLNAWDAYQRRSYLPELDGLRAVSIFTVVAYHMHDSYWKWLNGPLGVTIFFVLSGYLITMLALREERSRGDLCFSAFYIRRSFRIFPAYYLTLGLYCLTILVLGMRPDLRQALLKVLLYDLFYFQELPHQQGFDGTFSIPFGQSWSLGIEEKFYLFWPILAFWLWRSDRRNRLVGALVLTVGFTMAPSLKYAGLDLLGKLLVPYSRILIGCLIALLLDDRVWFGRLSFLGRRMWSWTVLTVLIGLHSWISAEDPVGHAIYAIVCGALLVGMLTDGEAIRRVLAWGFLVAIGRLSYGIYLIHGFGINATEKIIKSGSGRVAIAAVSLVLTFAISAAMAYVMARLVERPCIALGRRLSAKAIEAHARRRAAVPADLSLERGL